MQRFCKAASKSVWQILVVAGFAVMLAEHSAVAQLKNSGALEFTSAEYFGTPTEGVSPYLSVPLIRSSLLGIRATVTRTGGSTGRVQVDYAGAASGTLTFNDHETSKSILVSSGGVLTLSNPRLATTENSNLITAPILGAQPTADVTVYDTSVPKIPTNAISFNFERANYAVREDEVAEGGTFTVQIYVNRDGDPAATKINYKILTLPLARGQDNRRNNVFETDAGSEYATPAENLTAIPEGNSPDFSGANGELNWGQNDFVPKAITLTITNDNLVEFNEDLIVQLFIEDPTTSDPRVIGEADTARLTVLYDDYPAGALDPAHNMDYDLSTVPPANPNPGANGVVYSTLIQSSGKTVIGGAFTAYNTVSRNRIARFNADGSNDGSFTPGTGANNFVTTLAQDASGKLYAGGGFTSYNGTQRNGIVRLNSNGLLDTTFNPGNGANSTVWALAIQPDGKVLIGGEFTVVGVDNRNYIARLNTDGTVDATFNPGIGPNGFVNSILVQADGKILIGGEFSTVSGLVRGNIARLNSDGTVDTSFNPGVGADGAVYAMIAQGSKLLIVGSFQNVDLRSSPRLARLNADGSYDTTFNVGAGADDTIYSINLQSDGKILIGGIFTSYNQTRRAGIARLMSDGIVDTSYLDTAFNDYAGLVNLNYSDPKNFVFSISLDLSQNVIIGGGFSRVGGGRSSSAVQPEGHDLHAYTRAAYRNRRNVAKLLGGSTTGPGVISFSYDNYTIDENSAQLYVTLSRDQGNLGAASADFAAIALPPGPGAAVAVTDFSTATPTITYDTTYGRTRMVTDGIYGPNTVSYTVVSNLFALFTGDDAYVDILDNLAQDGNRDALLQLTNPSTSIVLGGEVISVGVGLGKSLVPMTIVDNESSPGVLSLTATNYTVGENGVNAVISVVRTGGSVGNVTAQFQTSNGTAIAGSDYNATNGTITLLEGQTNKSFNVKIIDDSTIEPDETVNIVLYNPTGGLTLGQTNAVLTIVDNDFPGGKVSFTSATFATNENAVSAIIGVKRAGSGAGTLTVYAAATNGASGSPAISGADFTGVTNLLTWANGDTSTKTFVVPLLNDDAIENDETVTLRLFASTLNGASNPLSLGSVSNATLTILNDDNSGTVAFSAATYSVNENSGQAYITVIRTGGSSDSVTVNYAAVAGTAFDGVDFSATSGTLAFGPGEVSKTFAVSIIDNTGVDAARSITLTLSGASPVSALGSPAAAIINIVDDESSNEPPGSVDTDFNPSGASDAVFGVALQSDGKIIAAGSFTNMNGLTRNHIARLSTGGQLDTTFSSTAATAGADSTIHSLSVQTDGRIVVGGEFLNVTGSPRSRFARLNFDGSLDGGFDPGAGTDNPVFAVAETFLGTSRKIFIGGSFANYGGTPRNDIARINNDGTLDAGFAPVSGTDGIVYAIAAYPTNSALTGKVLVGGEFTSVNGVPRANIARFNADGSLDLSFNPGSGAAGAVRAVKLQADGRILIGGSFTNYNGTTLNRIARLNSDGSVDSTFNVGSGADDTVLSIALQADTRILLGGLFTHCNGVNRSRITRLNNDGTVDPSINFGAGANDFVASIAVQTDGKIVIGGGFTEYDGVPRQHIARIYGGSIAGSGTLEFTASDYQIQENLTNAVITVRRHGGTAGFTPGGSVTIDLTTADNTATNGVHYFGGTTTLTFAEGEVFASVTIPVVDDFEVNTDRIANLSLGNIQPAGSAAIGNQPTATLTIVNEDSAIAFESGSFTVAENAVDSQAAIRVIRFGAVSGTASVDFTTTTNGTATQGLDFAATTNHIVFATGETVKTVTIPIVNDVAIEGNETVILQLTNAFGSFLLAPSTATLTINDDDLGPGQIAFAAASYSAVENAGNAAISLIRTNGKSGVVSIKIQTTDITASAGSDYVGQNNVSVTFGDGETNKTVLIPLLDDSIVEGDEVFNLTLSNPTGGASILGTNTAPVTILENDEAFSLSSPIYLVGEAGPTLTISVLRIGGSNGVATVRYSTVGSAQSTNYSASAGSDFTGITNALLSFASGEVLKTFTIAIAEDTAVEGDETFGITLSNPSGTVQLLTSSAVATILDNDTGFTLSANSYSVDEGATNLIVTVYRTNANTGPASVSIATITSTNFTATPGADYTATGGALNFTNGEPAKTIAIPIVNDLIVEGNETFGIELSSPSPGAQIFGIIYATNTIVDNDSSLRFSSATYNVNENGVSATITVVREAVLTNTVAVNYSAGDGTAVAGADYNATSGQLVFTNGQTSKTFTVQVIDDTLEEGPETVLLSLSSPTGQVQLVSASAATLTIVDNDGGSILPAGSLITSETTTNGAIDANETVTVLFAMRNASGVDTTNLIATLLSTNGVTNVVTAPQSYGALANNGASVSRAFTFKAVGTNGGTISATFTVAEQTGQSYGRVTFTYVLGTTTTVFSNTAAITINDNAIASPYPSSISVTGLVGTVSKVVATVTNLYHPSPDDIDMLLAGPTGTNTMLMSDCGGGNLITNVTLTFDDSAATSLPDSTAISSGTNKPTNYLVADLLPAPAPVGPWGSTLAAFNGTNPNGQWSLYIKDDLTIFSGSVQRGWQLAITTLGTIAASTDLSVAATATPSIVVAGSNLTYTVTVTNHGPWAATGVQLTNALPAGATFVSATSGSYSTNGSVVWNIGALAKDAVATTTIVIAPATTGSAVLTSAVTGNESDPNTLNNVISKTNTVVSPQADLSVTVVDLPDPVLVAANSLLTYSITVSNGGPATASSVGITNTLSPSVAFVSATPAGYTVSSGVVTFANIGNIISGGTANLTIVVRPLATGQLTNVTAVGSAVFDPIKGNNAASVKTVVSGISFNRIGNSLVISWPSDTTATLQSTTNLASPIIWQNVTSPAVVTSGGMNYVTNTIGSGNRFFRLLAP